MRNMSVSKKTSVPRSQVCVYRRDQPEKSTISFLVDLSSFSPRAPSPQSAAGITRWRSLHGSRCTLPLYTDDRLFSLRHLGRSRSQVSAHLSTIRSGRLCDESLFAKHRDDSDRNNSKRCSSCSHRPVRSQLSSPATFMRDTEKLSCSLSHRQDAAAPTTW